MKSKIKILGFALILGFLFHNSIERYYFPAVDVKVFNKKNGDLIRDGLLGVVWQNTNDSIILQSDNGVFHIPKKVYYSFLGAFGGCKMMNFNFCNPYYLSTGSALNLFKVKTSNLDYLYQDTIPNGTKILWDFKKNKWKKPPTLEVQLSTRYLMDTMDMKFDNEMDLQDIIPFGYLLSAYNVGVNYDSVQIEKIWFEYIKIRCGTDRKKYEQMLNDSKYFIDKRKNKIIKEKVKIL